MKSNKFLYKGLGVNDYMRRKQNLCWIKNGWPMEIWACCIPNVSSKCNFNKNIFFLCMNTYLCFIMRQEKCAAMNFPPRQALGSVCSSSLSPSDKKWRKLFMLHLWWLSLFPSVAIFFHPHFPLSVSWDRSIGLLRKSVLMQR